MLDIRYRLTHRDGKPLPFAAWFEGAPDGRLHGLELSFEGPRGQATYVAAAPPDQFPTLERNVLSNPATNCDLWVLRRRQADLITLLGAWNEPIYPGVHSPMWIAKSVMPDASCSFTITRDAVRHRILAPSLEPAHALWRRLMDEMEKYAGFAAVDVACTLERLAPADGRLADAQSRHARTAHAFGATGNSDVPGALEDAAAYLGTTTGRLVERLGPED